MSVWFSLKTYFYRIQPRFVLRWEFGLVYYSDKNVVQNVPYQLDKSIFDFRGVWLYMYFHFIKNLPERKNPFTKQ